MKPFHFIFGTSSSSDDDSLMVQLVIFAVPLWMITQEIREINAQGTLMTSPRATIFVACCTHFRWPNVVTGLRRWLSSGWNMFEVVYILAVISFMNHVKSYMAAEGAFLEHYRAADGTEDFFNDAMPLRSRYKEMNKFVGVVVAISVFKLFKYIKIFRSTTVLWITIDKAKHQLVAYGTVMAVLIMSFTWLTVFLWGYQSTSFHNIPSALFALIRMSVGETEMEYSDLKRGDASATPFVFMGFVVFVAIIGMNLLIAIITDYYEEARDSEKAWKADREWIQNVFSSRDEYEDFYRGKGLWNEPATEQLTGLLGQAWNSLRGKWSVKPIPIGCGPRRWAPSEDAEIEDKVQPKFETQSYPFMLQRSSMVHLRYRVESHEHAGSNAGAVFTGPSDGGVRDAQAAAVHNDFDDNSGWKPVRSREDMPEIYPNSPEAFEDERKRKQAGALPQALDLWMTARHLSQYKGVRYLELFQDPSYKGVCIKDMSIDDLKKNLKDLGLKTESTEGQKLAHLWKELDVDKSNSLTFEEFKFGLPMLLNTRLTEQKVQQVFDAANQTKEGTSGKAETLSYDEFFDWWKKQDATTNGLAQSHRTELQDRLREYLAELADGKHTYGSHIDKESATPEEIAHMKKAKADTQPGDLIKLKTPGEGGLAGLMILEFQKFLPVRRASKRCKLELSKELDEARKDYNNALLKGHKVGRCKDHAEELIKKHAEGEDGDDLVSILRNQHKCEQCALAAHQDNVIKKKVENLQKLHKARGKLEGVERIMVFRVKSVEAWQKFKPMDVRSDESGQVGAKLVEAAGRRHPELPDVIGLKDVLDVCVEVVCNSLKHKWRYGTSLRSKLETKHVEGRKAFAESRGVSIAAIEDAIAADVAVSPDRVDSEDDPPCVEALLKKILAVRSDPISDILTTFDSYLMSCLTHLFCQCLVRRLRAECRRLTQMHG